MGVLRVKDIIPALSLARNQRLNIYGNPGCVLLKTVPHDALTKDPKAALGKHIWEYEVMQMDATSAAAFNIVVSTGR